MKSKHGKKLLCAVLIIGALCLQSGDTAFADGAEPLLGEIMWVPYNFAPRGWAFCNGQLLAIAQNTALFSLLGTTYGGNGTTTFALPDMRGRTTVIAGSGPGLSAYALGQAGGAETHTLLINEIPAHRHTAQASSAAGDMNIPAGAVWAKSGSGSNYAAAPAAAMAPQAVAAAGGGQPHANMIPYLTLNCLIAIEGIFPLRN